MMLQYVNERKYYRIIAL